MKKYIIGFFMLIAIILYFYFGNNVPMQNIPSGNIKTTNVNEIITSYIDIPIKNIEYSILDNNFTVSGTVQKNNLKAFLQNHNLYSNKIKVAYVLLPSEFYFKLFLNVTGDVDNLQIFLEKIQINEKTFDINVSLQK